MSKTKNQFKSQWILLIIIFTSLILTRYYEFAMMGFTTFILAYLSKGIRRKKNANF